MAKNSLSSIQNIDNWRLSIWKNKFIINFIIHQSNVDKIYVYANDLYDAKYQFLINKQKVQAQSILMILKLLCNTSMIWMIFIKTCSCYRTVTSAIWEIFSEFLIFCNLFYEPLGELNNSKIWETRKIFANIARSNVR